MNRYFIFLAFLMLLILSGHDLYGQENDFSDALLAPAHIQEGKLSCFTHRSIQYHKDTLFVISKPRAVFSTGLQPVDHLVSVIEILTLADSLIANSIVKNKNVATLENKLLLTPIPRDTLKIRAYSYMTHLTADKDNPDKSKVVFATSKLYEIIRPKKREGVAPMWVE